MEKGMTLNLQKILKELRPYRERKAVIDATATGNSDLHLASLKNLGFGFAYLLTCEELIEMLMRGNM
jgi:hypothetical protein